MRLITVPHKETIPSFDPNAIAIPYLSDAGCTYGEDGDQPLTEEVITRFLAKLSTGTDAIASLDPYCEDNWMEILCDGTWLALGYSSNDGQENYYSFNLDFAGSPEYCPLKSGGQSPIEEYLALTDLEAGRAAVEYFLRTGELYPGIDWAKQL